MTASRAVARIVAANDALSDGLSSWRLDPRHLPRRPWLYGKHYLRGALSLTVAPGGSGKSALAIAEAICMATGRDLLGVPVADKLNVFLWSGEEPVIEIARRVLAACQHFGVDPRELRNRLHIASALDESEPMIVARAHGSDIEFDSDAARWLRERLSAWQIDVMIVDPFKACHRCNENSNDAMDQLARFWARRAAKYNIALELLHHTRKVGQGEISADDARGASALIAAARGVRTISPMTEAEAARAGVKDASAYIRVAAAKANYAAKGVMTWLQLLPVELPGAGDDTTVAVAPWHRPDAFDGIEDSHRARVQAMAAKGQYRRDPRSEQWIGRAIAEATGLDPQADKARIKTIAKTWLADGTLREIEGKDATRHVRLYVKPGIGTAASVPFSD